MAPSGAQLQANYSKGQSNQARLGLVDDGGRRWGRGDAREGTVRRAGGATFRNLRGLP